MKLLTFSLTVRGFVASSREDAWIETTLWHDEYADSDVASSREDAWIETIFPTTKPMQWVWSRPPARTRGLKQIGTDASGNITGRVLPRGRVD